MRPWLWLGMLFVGVFGTSVALAMHTWAPGESAQAPKEIGQASFFEEGRPMLVVALHPGCPCSRATVKSLGDIIARASGEARIVALFVHPETVDGPLEQSELYQQVARLAGVEVWVDRNESYTAVLGPKTSGQTYLYGSAGDLLFAGGITAGRGHEGPSVGGAAIADWLSGRKAAREAPVYGCPMTAGHPVNSGPIPTI